MKWGLHQTLVAITFTWFALAGFACMLWSGLTLGEKVAVIVLDVVLLPAPFLLARLLLTVDAPRRRGAGR